MTACLLTAPLPLPTVSTGCKHAWHLYILQLQLEHLTCDRDEISRRLGAAGVAHSEHFIPLHRQPYWRVRSALTPAHFPVSEQAFQ